MHVIWNYYSRNIASYKLHVDLRCWRFRAQFWISAAQMKSRSIIKQQRTSFNCVWIIEIGDILKSQRRESNIRQTLFYQSQALWTECRFRPNISTLNRPFRFFSFIHHCKEHICSNRFINGCRTWPNWGNIFNPGNLSE